LITGKPFDSTTINLAGKDIRNLHNIGKTTSYIKLFVYFGIVVFFVLFPLIDSKIKIKHQWLKYLKPSTYFIFTVIAMFLINQFALAMEAKFALENHALKSNVSEFEVIFIYYIGCLFVYELSLKEFPSKYCSN
jgi:hypothetical protein